MPRLPRDASSASDDQWPAGDAALAAFAEDLRMVASGPAPEPRPGLVAAMARGAEVPTGPQPGRPKMLVKTVLGSLAAKVALGVGVAAASVGAAGATGVLPDQAQHAVASVVNATTPFVLPDPSTARPQVADDVPTSSTSTTLARGTGTTLAGGAGDDAATGGHATEDQADNHGACVSAVAQDKSGTDSHGKTVSSVARSDCGKTTTSSTVPGSTTTSSTSSTSSTSTTVAGASPGVNGGSGSANNGKGNNGSNGSNGNGNQGKGSSENGNGGGSGNANKG
ncbi:MAG TPA: hypothetical protein VHT97_01505 [Acidimicrobiales bacterium]|jgi:hypothetical protein|nr:hypothetical protein [Acidimicrobiales bacterium]